MRDNTSNGPVRSICHAANLPRPVQLLNFAMVLNAAIAAAAKSLTQKLVAVEVRA